MFYTFCLYLVYKRCIPCAESLLEQTSEAHSVDKNLQVIERYRNETINFLHEYLVDAVF